MKVSKEQIKLSTPSDTTVPLDSSPPSSPPAASKPPPISSSLQHPQRTPSQISTKPTPVSMTGFSASSSSSSKVMTHIYVLYCLMGVLSGCLVASLWLGSCRIASLQKQLASKLSAKDWADVYSHVISQNVGADHATSLPDKIFLTADEGQVPNMRAMEAILKVLNGMDVVQGHSQQGESQRAENRSNSSSRQRRDADPQDPMDNPDEWLWMSSFSRIQLSAIHSYCREANLYCKAEGQAGPPGQPGEKGDVGNPGVPGATGAKGDKGAAPDPRLVAQNLGAMEKMRGPPGPKGDAGEKGAPGERGNMGPPGPNGRPGLSGLDGEKGDKGDPGEPGEKGMRGLIGFPGMKGEPGPQGPPGARGYNGANGEDGKRGRRGEPGPPGPQGLRGAAGVPGVPGLKGYKGDSGTMGPRGQKGERGMAGQCPAVCIEPRKIRTTTMTTTPAPTTTTSTPSTTTATTTTTTTTPMPTLPPRKNTCYIKMIGKALFKRQSGHMYGAWMRDAAPPSGVSRKLQWNTYGSKGSLLYQFSSERSMIRNSTDGIYDLSPIDFEGTGHVVYNHSLYYQRAGTWKIVRYDLRHRTTTAVNYVHHRNARYYGTEKLYKNLPGAMDFAVDQTGLWLIYANHKDPAGRAQMGYGDWANDNVFFLAKLDPQTMDQVKTFKLTVPMNYRGNGFMVCGTLYIVRKTDRTKTSIAWMYDAFTEVESHPKLAFSNPYGKMVQLSYDPRTRRVLGWDSGNLIIYPLLLQDQPVG